jgi:hypothetical protein
VLPRLRAAPADTLILADGFSCREQIEQGTGRRTLHLAEAIAEAMDLGDAPALRRRRTTPAEATLLLGGALALGLLIGGRALSRTRG